MKSKILKYLACIGMAFSLAVTVQATPISGTIDMGGTAILNNVALGSATAATSFTGVTVGGIPTGNFAGTFGTSVAWSGFGWNPFVPPVPQPLWSFVFAGKTFTFDLTSVTIVSQSNTFLNLLGGGTLKETGFDNTSGAWSFTISNPNGDPHATFAFTFANSQTANVPDGGTTVLLLGAALSGLALLRRKVA